MRKILLWAGWMGLPLSADFGSFVGHFCPVRANYLHKKNSTMLPQATVAFA